MAAQKCSHRWIGGKPFRLCGDAGLYLDTNNPYRGSGHGRQAKSFNGNQLVGVARRVFVNHESASYRAQNPAKHYQNYSGDHHYIHILSIPEDDLAKLFKVPLSATPSDNYNLRNAFWHSVEAVDILLSGYFPESLEPINQEATLLEVKTNEFLLHSPLNQAQALTGGRPFDSVSGRQAGLMSAQMMPFIRARRMGRPEGTTATRTEYMEWKCQARAKLSQGT